MNEKHTLLLHEYKFRNPTSGDSNDVVWNHYDVNQDDSAEQLKALDLEEIVSNALCVEETRPRAFATKTGLMVVLRGLNMNPGQDAEDMVSIRVWLEKSRIISARRRPLLAVRDMVSDIENDQGPQTAGQFLTSLVDKLANRIGDFVNTIEDKLGEVEDTFDDMDAEEFRRSLGDLRRQIASVRRYLAPQRDALDRLYHLQNDILSNSDSMRLREESDRVSRYLEDLDLARERAVVLQEAFLNQLAQEQNSRMYVLSLVAAIFLPLAFVTGLLGMNVGGLPGLDNPKGFLIATVTMISASVAIIAFFKWRKWI